MKYQTEVLIDLPRDRVVALAMDSALVPEWQKECVSRTLLEGEHLAVGSKTEVVTSMNGREMKMLETITITKLTFFRSKLNENGPFKCLTYLFFNFRANSIIYASKFAILQKLSFTTFTLQRCLSPHFPPGVTMSTQGKEHYESR